ncbi:MAG: hypothetical protein HY423_14310 [Candidatus Lambdaproteobacteria bacterium]|nr:hypothetical protein [Candidatus Lambdaproteobacteria bacterium]
MSAILLGLDLLTAATAFLAAAFWFMSSRKSAPPDTWDGGALLPSFLDEMSKFNRWAASFAGVSAFFAGIRILFQILCNSANEDTTRKIASALSFCGGGR